MYKVNRNITPDKIANLFSIANPHCNFRPEIGTGIAEVMGSNPVWA